MIFKQQANFVEHVFVDPSEDLFGSPNLKSSVNRSRICRAKCWVPDCYIKEVKD
jgi:hypothetical protein